MDSIVEENGNNSNNIETLSDVSISQASSNTPNSTTTTTVLTTGSNVVQFMPTHNIQPQSVIQANQSSVIQTAAANIQPVTMSKGGVLYVGKPNTVIHTASGNTVQIKHEPNTQIMDSNSEESLTDDDSPRRQREFTRRPSYHKILNDISGPDIAAGTTLQIQESGGIPTIASTGGTTGTLIQLTQETAPAFYLPNNSVLAEDQTRKREIRLQKNREAARECRRKKKEYIKCLENRVAVLENQNKALIEELKSLKELYCQTKNE
ncbi:cyclic AMP response element-binding protein B isoform X2 [Episyrphus balteatus]|uniref:cyclic AMP response element-binding protein B isoform X2 n=1 Tax=Episyrphus balteatus TaxID=286459 RepID=UPI002484E39B|nr:cyclic AMP response element-binding protein B isoform X2 [Episyrphus balteatus]XP_055911500.1 cyclic AMP response element-binding protein B isoform X2 [Eupeodes corollae]